MNVYYDNLSPDKKISMNHSINSSIKKFLKEYNWDISFFDKKEDIVDNIYFYWFRMLAKKKYRFSEGITDEFFNDAFIQETRMRIEQKFKKIYKKGVKSRRKRHS